MKNYLKKILVPILALVTVTGLSLSGCAAAFEGSISISSPSPGDVFQAGSGITVSVSVTDFELGDDSDGHVIHYMDVTPPTTKGEPATTAAGTYATSSSTSYTWSNVNPGQHTFSVQLVNSENEPFDPPATDTVSITVLGVPTVEISSPANGAVLPAGDVTVNISVDNFDIVDKLGQENSLGEGHVHYYLDVDPPTVQGQPAVTEPGTYAATTETSFTWADVSPGEHTLSVQLVNNNHTPLTTPITAQITVTLEADFPLVEGWYKEGVVTYYDFGLNTPLVDGEVPTAPIYAFIYGFNDDGSPDFVRGQHNIIDLLPGEAGYSDLWHVHLVTVPADYTVDSVRSRADILEAGYMMTPTDILVNCPVVPEGSTLATGKTLTQGWYQDQAIYYADYGSNPAAWAPIWAFITGFDNDGNPLFVAGQNNVIDVVPGDTGYSDFWRVNLVTVPAGYTADTITSLEGVMDSGYPVTQTDLLVNCPVVDAPPRTFNLVNGWFKGEDVVYYDFGAHTPLNPDGSVPVAPIYAFIFGFNADGSPDFVPDQHNIIDVMLGDPGYSDLWQVHLVTVPADYVADSVKSFGGIFAAGYQVTATDILVNCPLVPAGSTLETGKTLTQGWYLGQAVYYADYGENPAVSAPIWAFITGFDSEGNPMFVEGQKNVIDVIPGDAGYSAFWRVRLVTVPGNYVANSITSAAEVASSGYLVTQTDILVNCPVV